MTTDIPDRETLASRVEDWVIEHGPSGFSVAARRMAHEFKVPMRDVAYAIHAALYKEPKLVGLTDQGILYCESDVR